MLLPNQYVISRENVIGGCAITKDECTTAEWIKFFYFGKHKYSLFFEFHIMQN